MVFEFGAANPKSETRKSIAQVAAKESGAAVVTNRGIALRDFGLSLGALALSRLSAQFEHHPVV
jgi:hypothetical protein